ncbi:eCIS core domain-containing protein [Chitinophaga sp. ARDCPP14]|uniref:eCIS core domain-containing protein n=1 Tax=Chitinophaga sp. ARDCPP14 TaxID=3391139 RepID=UPI003F51F31C
MAAANTQIQPPGLKSSAPQQREGPFFGPTPVKDPFFQRKEQHGEEDGTLQREATANATPDVTPAVEQQLSQSKGNGAPLPSRRNEEMSRAFGTDLSGVRIHEDAGAADMSRQLQAKAFTHGTDIYFGANQHNDSAEGKHLLAHELTHIVQQSPAQMISRAPLAYAYSKFKLANKVELLGDGTAANTGMSLDEFNSYIRRRADWFAESTLIEADRKALWKMIAKIDEGPHILAGASDLKLKDLIPLTPDEWTKLGAFGNGCNQGDTVIILNTTPPVARRMALGKTMLELEKLIGGKVLHETVSELQLIDVEARPVLLTNLKDYWKDFQPHLQRGYSPGAGARGAEFQKMINMFTALSPSVYSDLKGRIRNLHRFSTLALNKLVANYGNRLKLFPLHLIIHTGIDASAFQDAAPKFEDVIINSPNLVLMLEGQNSIADIIKEVPKIAATYGKGSQIAQVIIAGHGSPHSLELAGTSLPNVVKGRVDYNSESLDISKPLEKLKTKALLDVLINNLDPATARIVFAGCLVGAHPVPTGTAAANVAPYLAANPNVVEYTQQRAAALGKPVQVEGARASVGLSATTLRDPVSNDLHIDYPFDPQAFGTAAAYLAVGREPEGVMRAAVEVAAANAATATVLLNNRMGIATTSWWDECVVAFVKVALKGLGPNPVSLAKLLELAQVAQFPFLAGFGTKYGISVAHFKGWINDRLAFAAEIYDEMLKTPSMMAAADTEKRIGRFLMEQAWLNFDPARAGAFVTFLEGVPSDFVRHMEVHLDVAIIKPSDATLFAPAAPHTSGRIRLALAWLHNEPANAFVKAFFRNEISNTATGPKLSALVTAELAGRQPDEILGPLGRLAPRSDKPGDDRPLANARIPGRGFNNLLIDQKAYIATVTALKKLPVFRGPGPKHKGIGWVKPGDLLQVAGFTGAWAAFDFNGKLGYVDKTQITPP